MADYVQEMAAVICMSDSGEVRIVSTHLTSQEAYDELSRMRESGEAREWTGGNLLVIDGGVCHAHIDMDGLRARLAALEELLNR